MEKTMVLWKKLWYYTEKYGTLINYRKNYGTMEKTITCMERKQCHKLYT